MAEDDDGALLLLAGFILGVALIVTGLTLSEVAQLENEAVREQDSSFIAEYRSMRGKVERALHDSVTMTTDETTFLITFNSVRANFEQLASARGYNFMMVVAGNTDNDCTGPATIATRAECPDYTVVDAATCPSSFENRKYAGTDDPDGVNDPDVDGECYDGTDNGLVKPASTLEGVFVFLHFDDPTQTIEETAFFALNSP